MGAGFVFAFSFLTAGKEVVSGNTLQDTDPFLLVFVTFLAVASVCLLLTRLQGQRLGLRPEDRRDLIVVNVCSTCSWLFFFYALKYLEPALVTAVITASGPLVTLCTDHIFRLKRDARMSDVLTGIGIACVTVYLLWVASTGRSAFASTDKVSVWISLAGCFFTGISVAFTTVYSKRLYDKGWSPTRLMAHRFYLLIFLSGIASLRVEDGIEQVVHNLGPIVLITFGGVLIPIYLLQLGIQRISPVMVATIISIGPAFTILLELLDQRLDWSWASFGGVVALVSLVLTNTILGAKESRESADEALLRNR